MGVPVPADEVRDVPAPARVLVATTSEDVLDELLRLVAAARAEPLVAHDRGAARRWWPDADLVLVAADMVEALGSAPTRRDGVVLVGQGRPDAGLYESALRLGAEHVAVLPEGAAWVAERMAAAEDSRRRGVVAGVVGCRGGAGASVLTAALAMQATADGLSTVVVDADPLGADLDLLLDMTDEPGLRWGDLAGSHGRLPAAPIAQALPQRAGVSLLCGLPGPPHVPGSAVVASVLTALPRAFDLVLVDIPRWLPAHDCCLQAASAVLLLTTDDLRGVATARRRASELTVGSTPVRLVVRAGKAAAMDPQELAERLDVPLAGVLRSDPRVAADVQRGDLLLRSSLRRTSRTLLAGLVPQPTVRRA